MSTWVPGAAGSAYDVDNLPLGVFSHRDQGPRAGVRIGDRVVDLAPVAAATGFEPAGLFEAASLNPFLAAGPDAWDATRQWLVALLTDHARADLVSPWLIPVSEVALRLPFEVADYVDFYASIHHATNVGRIFRPDGEALTPNWRRLPIGYHGRAGTVVVSGTGVRRPSGQRHADDFGPCRRLDVEAELGFVVGTPSTHGDPVPADAWKDHVFGVTLLNDWSARDIQAFEYVPLGPFLGKSFATSISPWITPLAALEPAVCALPGQDPAPLPYLQVDGGAPGLDIEVEVVLNGRVVSRPPYSSMYWSPAQMLAHLTVNGASLRTGDLFASGTISGPEHDQRGSFLELSWGGREPFADNRTFLEDGDTVTLRASAPGALGGRIALGEVTGTILPA
ncbi:MAG: fumarylacetoacetase [Nocardioidaceae bacterium]